MYELESHKEGMKVRSYGPAHSGSLCSCAGGPVDRTRLSGALEASEHEE